MKPLLYSIFLYCFLFANSLLAQHLNVIDVVPGSNGSLPLNKIVFKNKLYFLTRDSSQRYYLHYIDSNDNHGRVFNLPIRIGTSPGRMAVTKKNGKDEYLFFQAEHSTLGNELFKYDGINPPVIAYDIDTGPASGQPRYLTELNNMIYFIASHNSGFLTDLMSYNPANGVLTVHYKYKPLGKSGMYELYAFKGQIYLPVLHNIYDLEPWVYNPIKDSLFLLADIRPGTDRGDPVFLDTLNGKLYFKAWDGNSSNQNNLYEYSGTGNIKKLTPTTRYIGPVACFFKGSLYFEGGDNTNPLGLYKYTPASSQFSFVHNLGNKGNSLRIGAMKVYKNKLYFSATDIDSGTSQNIELWQYDGVNPPSLVADINAAGSSSPNDFVEYAGYLYFTAAQPQYGHELYKLLDWPTGVKNVMFDGSATIFPNPAQTVVNIKIHLKEPETLRATVCDITGQVSADKDFQLFSAGRHNISLNVADMAPGNYFIHLQRKDGRLLYSGKFIKQ